MIEPADIKRARQRLGESQAAFAKRFGVNQSTLQRWETGGVTESGTARIAIEYVLAELACSSSQAAE